MFGSLSDDFLPRSHWGYSPCLTVYPVHCNINCRWPEHNCCQRSEEWHNYLDIQGFNPENVKIETKDDKIVVNAARYEGDEVNGFDRREARRVLDMPTGVDPESIQVAADKNRRVYLLGQKKDTTQDVQERRDSNLWSQFFNNIPMYENSNNIVEDESGLKKFKVSYDMSGYKPEEIKVKQNGNQIDITAEHKDESDGRYVHRQFYRTHHLPKGTMLDKVKSTLNKSGQLEICAPVTEVAVEEGEKNLPIEMMDQQ